MIELCSSDVLTEVMDDVAVITFNRPALGNAVRLETMQAFCEALDLHTASPGVRAMVITGAGDHFLAGPDFAFLRELAAATPRARDRIHGWFHGATQRVWDSGKPIVAAIPGAAIAIGCEIALASDVRFATEVASFQDTWSEMCLVPPFEGPMLLPQLVGPTLAEEMIFQSRALSGKEARELGLVNELLPRDNLLAAAIARARDIADRFPTAEYRATKRALRQGIRSTMTPEWWNDVIRRGPNLPAEELRARLAALSREVEVPSAPRVEL
jgi:enoyl-CoA hydratase/carnithine racemase